MGLRIRQLAVIAALALAAAPAAAQQSNIAASDAAPTSAAAGWTFTPSLGWATTWDDNVLLRGSGDPQLGDQTTVLSPAGRLDYGGKRNQLNLDYSGAILLYRQFDTLDTFDQRGSVYARHALSPHVALFVHDSIARTPSTELSEFVGVPFVVTGSFVDDARGGIEAGLSAHTTLTASYHAQFISFDQTYAPQLLGGHSQGGTLSVRHQLSNVTTLIADYDYQHATIGGVPPPTSFAGAGADDVFDVHNGAAGLERRLSALLRVYGMFGIARVGASAFNPASMGPAVRAGLARDFRTGGLDVSYSRAFVPAYGFGGVMQSADLTGRLHVPITRRVNVQTAVSWRSDQPLTPGQLGFESLWLEGSVSYAFERWLQIEAFYASAQQAIDVAGGTIDRRRIGIQIVTTTPTPMRFR